MGYLLKFLAKTIKISGLISWRTQVYNRQRHIFLKNVHQNTNEMIFHYSCQFMPFSFNSLVHLEKARLRTIQEGLKTSTV